jgi:hypothetical protein
VGKAMTNETALITVIDHLVDNSVKYSPDGGPIEVSLKARNGKVALAVSDQGKEVLAGRVLGREAFRGHGHRPLHRQLARHPDGG